MTKSKTTGPKDGKLMKHILGHIPKGGKYLRHEEAGFRRTTWGNIETPMLKVYFQWSDGVRTFTIPEKFGSGGK